jgi:hypothetical protein
MKPSGKANMDGYRGSVNIIPTVLWSVHRWNSTKPTVTHTARLIYDMNQRYVGQDILPPRGWTRVEYDEETHLDPPPYYTWLQWPNFGGA